jgi:uncharacterized membrane protein YraQ (UPF0718 family)
VVAARAALGVVSASVIGLTLAARPPRGRVLSGGSFDAAACGCGYYEDADAPASLRAKLGLLLRHAQAEFWNVGKYLIIGTFVSAAVQTVIPDLFSRTDTGAGLAASTAVMMAAGFLLSLCSSSDAVVARSFMGRFPMGALMGFLVFGPIMDIKNAMLLSSGFTVRFVVRLAITAFIVCFITVFLYYRLQGGTWI